MMQLVCNGVALDLLSGAALAFKKVNPLFAFDALTCERTQAFELPATAKNNRVFELAKDPAYYGTGMRRRYEAELQDGVMVKRGYLYVDEYSADRYKAVFVTGDLLGLKLIKEAGNIPDVFAPTAQAVWGGAISAGAAAITRPLWQSVEYAQQFAGTPYPSYSLQQVVDACLQSLGVSVPQYPAGAENVRIIPGELKRIDDSLKVSSRPVVTEVGEVASINALQTDNRYFDFDTIPYENMVGGYCDQFRGIDEHDNPINVRYLGFGDVPAPDVVKTLQCLRARFDCDITFGEDTPDTMRIVDTMAIVERDYGIYMEQPEHREGLGAFGSLRMYNKQEGGTWTFNTIMQSESTFAGLPVGRLAGRTIHLSAGDKLAFIDTADMATDEAFDFVTGEWRVADNQLRNGGQPYEVAGQSAFEINMQILTAEPVVGEGAYLLPNLPKITVIEALQTIAALYGRVLNYSDADGITFETLADVAEWTVLDVTGRTLQFSALARRFGKYAQHNIIDFDSAERVRTGERLTVDYTIDNDNIEQESTLQTVPFSEGGVFGVGFTTFVPVYVRNGVEEQQHDKDTITQAGAGDTYLGRVGLSRNSGIVALCNASTCASMSVRMTLAEYERMTSKTVIYYAGTRYVWTEAQWKNNTAQIKVSKIG